MMGTRIMSAEPPHSGELAASRGHAGGDFFSLYEFIQAVKGNAPARIDVRMSLEMSMPGILAHRSALLGNVPLEVPDLDDPAVRDRSETILLPHIQLTMSRAMSHHLLIPKLPSSWARSPRLLPL